MAQIASQHRQLVDHRSGGDSEVGKSGTLALATGTSRKSTGHAGGGYVKRQNAISIKMQDRLQPIALSKAQEVVAADLVSTRHSLLVLRSPSSHLRKSSCALAERLAAIRCAAG